jgi:hypothetical protein
VIDSGAGRHHRLGHSEAQAGVALPPNHGDAGGIGGMVGCAMVVRARPSGRAARARIGLVALTADMKALLGKDGDIAVAARTAVRGGAASPVRLRRRPAERARSGSRAGSFGPCRPDLGHAGMAAAGFTPFLGSWLRVDDGDCSSVVRVPTEPFHGGGC